MQDDLFKKIFNIFKSNYKAFGVKGILLTLALGALIFLAFALHFEG